MIQITKKKNIIVVSDSWMETHLNQKNIETYQSIPHNNFDSILLKKFKHINWPIQQLILFVNDPYKFTNSILS